MTDEHRLQMAAQLIVKSRDPDCSYCRGTGIWEAPHEYHTWDLCVCCRTHIREQITASGFLSELNLAGARDMIKWAESPEAHGIDPTYEAMIADMELPANDKEAMAQQEAVRNYNGMSEDFEDEVRPL